MESDSSYAIGWVSKRKSPWKFHFHLNEIRELSFGTNVFSRNSMADVLANQGVYRLLS